MFRVTLFIADSSPIIARIQKPNASLLPTDCSIVGGASRKHQISVRFQLIAAAVALLVCLAFLSTGALQAYAAKPSVLSDDDWPVAPIPHSLATGQLLEGHAATVYPAHKTNGLADMWYQGLASDGVYLYQIEDLKDNNKNQAGIGIHRMKPNGSESDWLTYKGSTFIDAIKGGNSATCLKIGKKKTLAISGQDKNGKSIVWLADISGKKLKHLRKIKFSFIVKGLAFARAEKKSAVMYVADDKRNLYETTITSKSKGKVKAALIMKMRIPTPGDGVIDGKRIGTDADGNAIIASPALQDIAYHDGLIYTFDQHDHIAGNGNTYLYAYSVKKAKKGKKAKKAKPVTASYKKVYFARKHGFYYREVEGLAFVGNTCYVSNVAYDIANHKKMRFIFAMRKHVDKVKLDRNTYSFTGRKIKPKPTVLFNGRALSAGKDYTVSYENNVKPGTASITVTGINGCQGSKRITFNIVQEKPTITLKTKSKQVTAEQAARSATTLAMGVKSPSKGKISYKVKSRDKEITFKKGTATLKRGAYRAGQTFKIKVKVTVARTARYKKASKTFTLKFTIKPAEQANWLVADDELYWY